MSAGSLGGRIRELGASWGKARETGADAGTEKQRKKHDNCTCINRGILCVFLFVCFVFVFVLIDCLVAQITHDKNA